MVGGIFYHDCICTCICICTRICYCIGDALTTDSLFWWVPKHIYLRSYNIQKLLRYLWWFFMISIDFVGYLENFQCLWSYFVISIDISDIFDNFSGTLQVSSLSIIFPGLRERTTSTDSHTLVRLYQIGLDQIRLNQMREQTIITNFHTLVSCSSP